MKHEVKQKTLIGKSATQYLQEHLQIAEMTNYPDRIDICHYLDTEDKDSECHTVSVESYEAWLRDNGRMTGTIDATDASGSPSVHTYQFESYEAYMSETDWQVRYEDAKEYLIAKGIVKVEASISLLKDLAKAV